MKNLKGLVIVMMLVSALSVSAVPTFAASPAVPGNGFGDHNHHHTGPPGQSNRPDDHVKASFNIIVAAEGSVHAVLEVMNGIIHTIHFG